MYIFELFEAKNLKVVVILPGGFHPFHPGHLSLYTSAQKMFPGADIYYAATNDKSQRPFDIADKAALAQIAGVPKGHFVQVTSPFQAKEIVSKYDPDSTVVVFARSEKDKDEPPHAGGVKKNGEPAYLQPWDGKPETASKHAYMAYLPTVKFPAGPSGITSATQIRDMWPNASAEQKTEIVNDLYPNNPQAAANILNKYLSGSVSEEKNIDLKGFQLLRKAKIAHPNAKSDNEALALYIADKEQRDVNRIDNVNGSEDRLISNLGKSVDDIRRRLNDIEKRV